METIKHEEFELTFYDKDLPNYEFSRVFHVVKYETSSTIIFYYVLPKNFVDVFNSIDQSKIKIPNVLPEKFFRCQITNPEICDEITEKLGFKVHCLVQAEIVTKNIGSNSYLHSYKTTYAYNPTTITYIDIQFGLILMLNMFLWYSKYPKQMVWWKFLGLDSNEDQHAHVLLNNIEYYKSIWKNCNWEEETIALFNAINKNKSCIGSNTELKLTNRNNYDAIDYYIKCNIDNKMENLSKTINNYLKEVVSERISLASFIDVSSTYKLSVLKRRNEQTRLLKTQFL